MCFILRSEGKLKESTAQHISTTDDALLILSCAAATAATNKNQIIIRAYRTHKTHDKQRSAKTNEKRRRQEKQRKKKRFQIYFFITKESSSGSFVRLFAFASKLLDQTNMFIHISSESVSVSGESGSAMDSGHILVVVKPQPTIDNVTVDSSCSQALIENGNERNTQKPSSFFSPLIVYSTVPKH